VRAGRRIDGEVEEGESAFATRSASAATVGAPSRLWDGSSTLRTPRSLETSWTARSESPPSAKKSSWMPIRSIPKSFSHASAIMRSIGSRGAT
jgi:hypothetical protein